MPKLYCKKNGSYYTRVLVDNKIATFQIDHEGVRILRTLGYKDGENFDVKDFWRLHHSDHTYTFENKLVGPDGHEGTKLIVKPEGPPNIHDPKLGPGWIHRREGENIKILFRDKKEFFIKTYKEKMYFNYLAEAKNTPKSFSDEYLIDELSKVLKFRGKAEKAFYCIFDSMRTSLEAHDAVIISEFGRFSVVVKKKKKKKRITKNGEYITYTQRKWKIKFRPLMIL